MKQIQEAVRAYLEEAAGIRTVAGRTPVRGEYPLLAVRLQKDDATLLAGGRLAEHTYKVFITAASDRNREGSTALLSDLWPLLLQGIPLRQDGDPRVLHPLHLSTEGDTLSFTLEVCVPVPSPADKQPAQPMGSLHISL